MSSSIHTAPCVLKTNEEIEICPAYQCIPSLTKQVLAGVVCEGFALVPNLNKTLAFRSRQFAPKIVGPSVRFIRISFCSSLSASVAGGGSRPRSEAPCITYTLLVPFRDRGLD